MSSSEIKLRYGCNPHQAPARVFVDRGSMPITVLNGSPGYINLLDAVNAWQLVKELRCSLELPAAASFKHVSPAGAAIGMPLSASLQAAYFVADCELTPLAAAYARARGADRMSSFGDWAALSDTVDVATAQLLKREVSDGVIASGYEPKALEILLQKKEGKYNVVKIDSAYQPPPRERRDIFGITFEQKRNDYAVTPGAFANIVTKNTEMSSSARRDLTVAQIACKYTQSNSVVLAFDGQVIGTGAGQQSRVHCVRLAAAKADRWFLRQHPSVAALEFREGIKRPDRDNAIDQYLEDDLSPAEDRLWRESFVAPPQRLTRDERRSWIDLLRGVALASDAFFPFRDSIDRASRSGVQYLVQPGGALRDDIVTAACDEYGMVMACTGVRLFHH